jgi:hypothetical protein
VAAEDRRDPRRPPAWRLASRDRGGAGNRSRGWSRGRGERRLTRRG